MAFRDTASDEVFGLLVSSEPTDGDDVQGTVHQHQLLGQDSHMSRSGNVWDNAAMESFFCSLKTERIRNRVYRTRDEARADVCDYIERFYNAVRRHSTIGYVSPVEFENKAGLA
jgi:transposase InsO family protein